ncbi:hypothetical protein M514_20343 [Trichuris suis]|uniref:Uncharacterized protein n=1 Tax=Trichuris suis TaxID=68888 RepID=A0A085NDF6_9BILA|nr:hypothetical protein M514_20343 [Trichuris suis]
MKLTLSKEFFKPIVDAFSDSGVVVNEEVIETVRNAVEEKMCVVVLTSVEFMKDDGRKKLFVADCIAALKKLKEEMQLSSGLRCILKLPLTMLHGSDQSMLLELVFHQADKMFGTKSLGMLILLGQHPANCVECCLGKTKETGRSQNGFPCGD